MFRSPKPLYMVLILISMLTLASCQLRREESAGADAQPVGDLSPTLAPLGADSSELANAVPPTVIIVDPTATPSTLEIDAATLDEPAAPTSQPAVDLSSEASGESEVEPAAVEPESFVLPEDQPAEEEATAPEGVTAEPVAAEEAALEAPVIANAVTDNELPSGGPIAANPPASATTGDYSATVADGNTYIVRSGDTLFSISQRYGVTVEGLMFANGLTSELIYDGQVLNIAGGYEGGYDNSYAAPSSAYAPAAPGVEGAHVVAPGETLFSIATRYGSSVEAIAGANGVPYPYIIYPGQTLRIASYPGYAPGSNLSGNYNPYNNPYNTAPNAYGQPGSNPYYSPDNYTPYDNNPYGQPNLYPDPNANPYYQPNYGPPSNTFANPGGMATHVVAPGDTLFSIALRYGLSAESIAAANGIANPDQIAVGQVLYLP